MIRRRSTVSSLAGAVLLTLCLSACTGTPPQPQEPWPEGTVVVDIVGLRFEPREVVVEPGARVVFVNRDRAAHNVVHGTPGSLGAGEPLFQSPELAPGQSWSYVFGEEGEYPYLCTVANHYLLGMTGTVIVTREPRR